MHPHRGCVWGADRGHVHSPQYTVLANGDRGEKTALVTDRTRHGQHLFVPFFEALKDPDQNATCQGTPTHMVEYAGFVASFF